MSITKDVMEEFAHGGIASVRRRFSDDLKATVSEGDLKNAHDDLISAACEFQAQLSQTARMTQGTPIYICKAQFENFKVEMKLMFEDSNQISDVRISPILDVSPESMEASARAITDLLRRQQFKEVSAQFNDPMKESMPADRLEASWMHVMTHLGPFKSIRTARKDAEMDRVDVRCEFENGPMIVRIAFDPSGKIAGMWMRCRAETEEEFSDLK